MSLWSIMLLQFPHGLCSRFKVLPLSAVALGRSVLTRPMLMASFQHVISSPPKLLLHRNRDKDMKKWGNCKDTVIPCGPFIYPMLRSLSRVKPVLLPLLHLPLKYHVARHIWFDLFYDCQLKLSFCFPPHWCFIGSSVCLKRRRPQWV